jgi:hypothetical protein
MYNITSMQKACIAADRMIDAATVRMLRRSYENNLRNAAHWRATALERSRMGLSMIYFTVRRAEFYLNAARDDRLEIQRLLNS